MIYNENKCNKKQIQNMIFISFKSEYDFISN